tara:strand:- start:751 stop:1416 length:666 start_codon:yes stop_codon:yes gene_type:complete
MGMSDRLDGLVRAGLLTEGQRVKVANRHAENVRLLEKEAAPPPVPVKDWFQRNPVMGKLTQGALIAGGAAATAAIGAAMTDVYRSVKDSVTKARDQKAMMAANPQLKDLDAQAVNRSYHVVRTMMPGLAGDPVVAGAIVGNLAQRASWGLDEMQNMARTQSEFTRGRPLSDDHFTNAMIAGATSGLKDLGAGLVTSPTDQLKLDQMQDLKAHGWVSPKDRP